MITDLLFTAVCLGLAFVVTLDVHTLRRAPRASDLRQDRVRRRD
ncbi:MAG TPA: hypothetical protein VKC51_10330 [Lacunisphaera sp.]|nr:hypothetical protein [Lacunisphaera sp.]